MKCIKENKFLKDHIIICKQKLVMDEHVMIEEMQDVVEIINKSEVNPKRKKKERTVI